jgi:galactokinase
MNAWAPGRINLIGEHTDYSGGLVLPAAIELGLTAEVHRRSPEIRLSSTSFGDARPFAADGSGPAARGWARFGQAVAAELNELGRPAAGITAIALTLCAVADFHVDPLELANACRRAEQRAVGVPCGILDQAACLLGEPDAAVLIDCASLAHVLIPVPADAAFLVIDSSIQRQLENTGYADRQRELQRALTTTGAANPRELTLRDLDPLEPVLSRRLRHVITENERVQQFADALEADDLKAAGRIMSASHASLRDDYEVSLPQLDELAAAAEECGAFGARLLGGGFGGAVLALVEASRATEVGRLIGRVHRRGRRPLVVHASRGARIDAAARAGG